MRPSIYRVSLIRKNVTIDSNIRRLVLLDCLSIVEERQHIWFDVIDEDKVDRRVLGNLGVFGMGELGNVVVGQWRVESIVTGTGTSLHVNHKQIG